MNPDFIIGGVLVAVGIIAILVRRRFMQLIYRGLRLFYGEPVADDSIRGRPLVRIALVGAFMIVAGSVMLVTAFIGLS
ncbi:hypothetical protein [Microbacterium sp. NPDC090003]|uniref:hypothetical protein n=1 Tax=Microbacterium sp. NPDC090003 TaxID=3364203 RepID=UPI00382317B4